MVLGSCHMLTVGLFNFRTHGIFTLKLAIAVAASPPCPAPTVQDLILIFLPLPVNRVLTLALLHSCTVTVFS